MLMLYHISCILAYLCVVHAQDPCISPVILNDTTRSVNYELGVTETDECDRLLATQWYRFASKGIIPTECPPLLRCGSTSPVWSSSGYPNGSWTQSTLQICQAGYRSCCDYSWTIDIHQCNDFIAFQLKGTPGCPGRYCVEIQRTPCKPGYASETGFEPCTPINVTFAVKPKVHPYITTFNMADPSKSELAFNCTADIPEEFHDFLFDIEWQIDYQKTATKLDIPFNLLMSNGSLYRQDWDPGFSKTLGFQVVCLWRIKIPGTSVTSVYVRSEEFYAGAVVETDNNMVKAGENIKVYVRSTVPVACKRPPPWSCPIAIQLYSFRHQFLGNIPRHCNTSLTDNDILQSPCGLEFDGSPGKWNVSQAINVFTLEDETSRSSYTAIIKLSGSSTMDDLWRNYRLPDLKLTVYKATTRRFGRCYSLTDPHFRTIDGSYFSSVAHGEFVLYRHVKKPVEVHTIQGDGGLNCGVAIRAASDIFLINGCDKRGKWIIRRECAGQRPYLDVYERNGGRQYDIILPTGTKVQVSLKHTNRNHWINIYIYPSYNDWNKTSGLCGTYNGKWYDDKLDRNGNLVSSTRFVESWSALESESLFAERIRDTILNENFLYCSCLNDAVGSNNVSCTWIESLPFCPQLFWSHKQCQIIGKRNAVDDIRIDVPKDKLVFKNITTEDMVWRNGWNESLAKSTCGAAIQMSPVYDICSSIDNVDIEGTINSCITDIQISGSDAFVANVRDSLKSECLAEMTTNTSFWKNSTSSEQSDLDTILQNDCPDDCSNAGTCQDGKCLCNSSYTGDDCSVKLHEPPLLADTYDDFVCDLSKRPCTSISIFGQNFYTSPNISCKITTAKISGNDIIVGDTIATLSGTLENFAEVRCPFSVSGTLRKRSTERHRPETYAIAVSMDGTLFSEYVPVVMFDSSCATCSSLENQIKCEMRTDICIVNGKCYSIMNSICEVKQEEKVIVKRENPKDYWIIGAVSGSVALVVICMVVFAKIYTQNRRTGVKESTFSAPMEKIPKY